MVRDYEDRFWSKVEVTGFCWNWGNGTAGEGYGVYSIRKPDGRWGMTYAHRYAYESMVGPIPAGLVIDHVCRNRICVNPDHLEPVTQMVNIERSYGNVRKTHCPQGHEYTEENTRTTKRGRKCRACDRDRARRNRKAGQNVQGV